MNGYIAYYKGKQFKIYAETSYKAQQEVARIHKIKKAYEITIMLAEKDGEQYVHRML
jgi:hypothetical protein